MQKTILIVDDHASFRRAARRLLAAQGFDVVGEAVDGTSAVEAVRQKKPQVVLLDVQLPDMQGFDVARLLREEDPLLTVILVSTREAADYGVQITEAAAAGFITKGQLTGAKVAEMAAEA